jgi:O-acetylhomoserine (thiol)-lyase
MSCCGDDDPRPVRARRGPDAPAPGWRFETLALHAGQAAEGPGPRAVPVQRTSSFLFEDTAHAAALFALKEEGHVYSRISNPTVAVLEERLTRLEGGRATVALASGTAAVFSAVATLAQAGDTVVSASDLYGGTYTLFDTILPRLGIRVKLVGPPDPRAVVAAIDASTRAVYIETIGNPGLDLADIAAVAEAAHGRGVPLVVDGTFTTPYLLRAIDHGADVVVNSLTKWLGGHGTAIGGAVTDAGRFDWAAGRHPLLSEPDPSYHGLRWAFDLPAFQAAAPFAARLRGVVLRNLGPCLSPDDAWLFLQGLETLPVRMERHCANALKVARFLRGHRAVAWVRYPGLAGDPSRAKARRYLRRGCGGVVVFGLKGGRRAAVALIDKVRLFSHAANVGDAKSLILHPASTTHSQLTEGQRREAGLTPDLVRLSVGLEHPDDLIAALEEALSRAAARRSRRSRR